MSNKTSKTGGPAFPTITRAESATTVIEKVPGMTLRDYFAGQALLGLSNYYGFGDGVAPDAYRVADAMLAARDAKPDPGDNHG